MKLSSAAFLEGFYFRPRIDKELLAAHKEGIICLSGCVSSELNRTLLAGGEANLEKAVEIAAWFRNVFGDDYYIEIQNNDLEIAAGGDGGGRRRSPSGWASPLVATSDVHYIHREDAEAQDILLCVNTGKFRTDTNRMRMESNEFYPPQRRRRCMPHFPAWTTPCGARQEIADGVDIELELGKRHFPVFTPAGGQDLGGVPPRVVFGGLEGALCESRRSLRRRRAFRRGDGPAGARAGRNQQAGIRQLLPDRLGLRAFRPRAGHPGHGPRFGRGLAGFLRAAPQPRLPAGVRPAVRALPGREPPRGARYRHRLLPAAPRRGDSIRQGQVRRGERGADRHLRHAGGSGGDPRRGPRAGPAHPAGRRRGGAGARGT